MPEENVEIALQVVAAVNRGDRSAFLLLNDPGLEFHAAAVWPEAGVLRGGEEVWDFAMSLNEAWEPSDYEIVEIIELGSKVALHITRAVVGKACGITDELDQWTLIRIRGGKIVAQDWFTGRAEALEAAEVPE
jgi:ketosteroid isomerase-like protein